MRERVFARIVHGAESVVSGVGITAQTVAERLRQPIQPAVDRFRSYYQHLDPRGRRRLGYAKISAAAIGLCTAGILVFGVILPGNTEGLIKIWAPAPVASVATWASQEIIDVIIDRFRVRHTPAT